ncbi:MAG TPA: hypothetical protein VIL49_04535 [Capillimicrobium sp.]
MLAASLPALHAVLPPADPAVFPGPDGGWAYDAIVAAAESGMVLEDPQAWHARFGALPLPGSVAFVLRRGNTRVLICHDEPLAEATAVRPALVFACEADDTPSEGVVAPGARAFVQDEVAVVWSLTRLGSVGAALERARYLAATVALP